MFPVGGDNEERDGGVYTGGPVGGCPLRSSRKWIFRCSECQLIEKSDRSDWMGAEYSVMASKL